ncbi:MAG: homoserine dehydrogenase [Robiginitomaculum sp.]|nr:MAG: homoserine dehydrogenase [Robiginitomaculum sp.]
MKYNIALIGFGGVNRTLGEIIHRKRTEFTNMGIELNVVSISDLFYGDIHDDNGLDIERILNEEPEKGLFGKFQNGSSECNPLSVIQKTNADIVSEATYSNPTDGQPALGYCEAALTRGIHVVTTNKGPVATASNELKKLARDNDCRFEYEGVVMSGTPVIRFVNQDLEGCNVTGFRGILNGTANYVLGQVEGGKSQSEAIKEAQELGYAEADPTADIEGGDVLLKVRILANVLWGKTLNDSDIVREGISGLPDDAVRAALLEGRRWKLIGEASIDDNSKVTASVKPELLGSNDILVGISGATNAITFNTEYLGNVMISGPGAGKEETAFALLSDIIAINKNR